LFGGVLEALHTIGHFLPIALPRLLMTYETISPADIPGSPLAKAFEQPLMLGVFLDLQDIKRSRLPRTSTWTFDYNAEVVRKADELGFELAFSRTQWLPKGGYDGEASLDAFVALGAMAAITRNILPRSITSPRAAGGSTS
jgi:FMNH2-dependent dimethyl sulfone monooxygenase